MAGIDIDHTPWPIVVVTFRGTPTEAGFDDYLTTQTQQLGKRERVAVVLDARGAGRTPASQRRKPAEWQREHEEALARYCAGTAFAVASPLVRGMLTAILWMQPLPCPHQISATLDGALDWARAQLGDVAAASR